MKKVLALLVVCVMACGDVGLDGIKFGNDVCDNGSTFCVYQNRCINLTSDKNHCGSCFDSCLKNQECIDSTCINVCATDYTLCHCSCIETIKFETDKYNCGYCGNVCQGECRNWKCI